MHRTATEIMMGHEREYRESLMDDRNIAKKETGYGDIKAYYSSIKSMGYVEGVVLNARAHVKMLEMMDAPEGNMYYSEKDEFYVDEWSIQTPEIYHRHKELGTYLTSDGMHIEAYKPEWAEVSSVYETHIQWDAANGECGLCGVQMPGEIMMMHCFYQF